MFRKLKPHAEKWVERIFEPLTPAVEDFAARHSMLLQKYPIGKPDWTLAALHPKGGQIVLVLRYNLIRTLVITALWQVRSPEKSVFHTLARSGRQCRIDPAEVTAILEEELAALVAAEFGNWTCTRPIPDLGEMASFKFDVTGRPAKKPRRFNEL